MNTNRPDSTLPLLMSIAFAAALLLAPMITHAGDDTAEQPTTTYPEQTLLAMNGVEADAHVQSAVRHVNRPNDTRPADAGDDLTLKLMMHRLAIGQ